MGEITYGVSGGKLLKASIFTTTIVWLCFLIFWIPVFTGMTFDTGTY